VDSLGVGIPATEPGSGSASPPLTVALPVTAVPTGASSHARKEIRPKGALPRLGVLTGVVDIVIVIVSQCAAIFQDFHVPEKQEGSIDWRAQRQVSKTCLLVVSSGGLTVIETTCPVEKTFFTASSESDVIGDILK